MAPDRYQWWVIVNSVIKLRFHIRRGISGLAEQLSASEEKLCSMELVESEGEDWIHLVHDREQWRVLANMVMNLEFHRGG
jgi:hypothetical protein